MRRGLGVIAAATVLAATLASAPGASAAPYTPDPNGYQPYSMAVGASPKGIASDGFVGATANGGDGTSTVFTTCQPKSCLPGVRFTMATGGQPSDTAVISDASGLSGRVYTTNEAAGTLAIIPFTTGPSAGAPAATTVTLGGAPTGIALSPDGAWAYVSDMAGARLLFFDTNALVVSAAVAVGPDPWGVVASPDGKYIYVAANAGGSVSVVDNASRTVVATIPVGSAPGMVALDPTGAFLYVSNNADGTVSVIDTSQRVAVATLTVGSQPWGVAVTATHAWVANYGSGTVSVIDTATRLPVAQVTTGSGPFDVVATGSQTILVTNSGSNTVSAIRERAWGPYVTWSKQKKTRTVTGVVPVEPAVTYSIVAKKGSATKRGTCVLQASGDAVSCKVKVRRGIWRVSVQAQLPWQPEPFGMQNKPFRF